MFDQKKIIGGAVKKYTLSIDTHPNATITLTPGPGKYKAGTQIRVNVTCSTGWQLGTITWNGTSIANGGTFSMPKGDCVVSCTTSQINYTITKSVPTGGGSITCADTAHYNDTVTYSTSASANWAYSSCALSGAKTQTLAASGSFVMPAGNVTITANFVKATGKVDVYMRGTSSRVLEGAIGSVYGSAYAQLEHYSNLKKQIHFTMDLVLGATYRVSGTFRDTSGEYQPLQAAYISIGTAQASQVSSKDFVMTQYIYSISINVNP